MNPESSFTWKDAKQIAEQIIFKKKRIRLSDLEIEVLKASWDGLTYENMAQEMSHRSEYKKYYSVDYLRGDVGFNLFRKFSEALSENVSKTNFKGALEREWNKQQQSQMASFLSFPLSSVGTTISCPEGFVPLDSHLYQKRNQIESFCFDAIVKEGSLIRIRGPQLMGKTSLMIRLLAQRESLSYRNVYLDLSTVERGIITNLNKFLRWLCMMVERQLQLESCLNDYWDTETLGSNDNCTFYFEEYLLPAIDCPIVLGLDNVDQIFPYSEVVEDFLGMLRSWHEKGKISPRWKQLRLIIAHSTECYIPLDINQSPFNAGIPLELKELDRKQIEDLIYKHKLNWDNFQIEALMDMVNGHPYLLSLAMYEVSCGKLTLEQILRCAPTEMGIYGNHLRGILDTLRKSPELVQAFKEVVASVEPVELDSIQIYKLHSMGLIQQQDNQVMPRCNLYREYFQRVLLPYSS